MGNGKHKDCNTDADEPTRDTYGRKFPGHIREGSSHRRKGHCKQHINPKTMGICELYQVVRLGKPLPGSPCNVYGGTAGLSEHRKGLSRDIERDILCLVPLKFEHHPQLS